jgi:hypothetical protein
MAGDILLTEGSPDPTLMPIQATLRMRFEMSVPRPAKGGLRGVAAQALAPAAERIPDSLEPELSKEDR